MGYGYRHTISYAPIIFLITATGIGWFIRNRPGVFAPCAAILCGLLLGLWTYSTFGENGKKNISDIRYQISEWAVDYKNRQYYIDYLIQKLGVSEEQYRRKVYWWWLGWAVAPEVYQDAAQKIDVKKTETSSWLEEAGNYIIMYLDSKNDSNFTIFSQVFDLTKIASGKENIRVFTAKLRDWRGAAPTGNSINRARLNPLEKAIEDLKIPEGLFAVNFKDKAGKEGNKSYILSLERGRIKILINIKEEHSDNTTTIRWDMVSPSLNGYYQEIKTIWKPYLMFTNPENGKIQRTILLDDVVGSFIYKTPLRGTIKIPNVSGRWNIAIGVKGWFDQSIMDIPILKDISWDTYGIKTKNTILLRQ